MKKLSLKTATPEEVFETLNKERFIIKLSILEKNALISCIKYFLGDFSRDEDSSLENNLIKLQEKLEDLHE